MVDPLWLLVIEVPAVLWLIVLAWRRMRRLTARITEVREEMDKNPQLPYAALAEMMQDRQGGDVPLTHVWPPAPTRGGRKAEESDGEGTDGTAAGSL